MRKLLCAAVVLFAGVGLAVGEEFGGILKKIEGNQVTVAKRQKDSKETQEVTLTVADNVKVSKGKFNREAKKLEAGEALAGGLKNEVFQNVGSEKGRGVFARFVTEGDRVTEITVMQFGGQGGGRKKKDSN